MNVSILSDKADIAAETVLLNVAIVPPEQVATVAADLSRQLAGRGGLFTIDNRTRHAHLTLYMARFARAHLDDVRARLRLALTGVSRFQLGQSGYFFTPGSYYEISYERGANLLAVHHTVTRSLYALRYSPGDPVIEDYFGPYSETQRENAKELGYDLAGTLYRPHITVSRMRDRPAFELPAPDIDLSFTATTVGLFQADNLGTARQLVDAFDIA